MPDSRLYMSKRAAARNLACCKVLVATPPFDHWQFIGAHIADSIHRSYRSQANGLGRLDGGAWEHTSIKGFIMFPSKNRRRCKGNPDVRSYCQRSMMHNHWAFYHHC